MNENRQIGIRRLLISIIIAFFYWITCMALNNEPFISHLLMASSMFVACGFIYDINSSFISIKNIFFWLFFVLGLFFRYIFIFVNPSMFCSFILIKTSITSEGFATTSLIVFVTVIIFAVAYNNTLKIRFIKNRDNKSQRIGHEYIWIRLIIIWFITFVISYGYNFMFINVGLEFDSYPKFYYGAMMLRNIVRAISYMFLSSFFQHNKKKYVWFYLIFIVSDIILSFLQAWKGQILYEVLSFFVIYYYSGRNLTKKAVIILGLSTLIVYPVITIYRDVLSGRSTFSLSGRGIIDYYNQIDFISVFSERYAYYDEIYHCLNIDKSLISQYLSECGTIFSQFMSGIIPRILWPNKPIINQGLFITKYIYGKSWVTASTISYIGDFFLSYGYLGIFLANILYASILNTVQLKIDKNDMLNTGINIVLSFLIIGFMEGTVAGKLITLLLTIVMLHVVKKICVISKSSKEANR